jgi:Plastocyanin
MDLKLMAVVGLVLLVSGCTSSTQTMDEAADETQEPEAQSPSEETPEQSSEDTMSGMDSEDSSPPAPPTPEPSSSTQESSASGESDNTITYTSSGFQPSSITTQPGETVTFVDQTGNGVWVGSNNHPMHRNYDGTSTGEHCNGGQRVGNPFDSCAAVSEFSFTFNEAGEYGYHNHRGPGDQGTVVVEEQT